MFVVALAAAAPLEDTAEVAAAKEEFLAAFAAAEAGGLVDLQAEPVTEQYLADDEAVAAAKAAFQAAFDDAAAGGLAAKQAPAPVHVVPEPTAVAAPAVAPAVVAAAPAFGYYPAPAAAYNYGYLNYPYAAPYNLAAFSQYPYTGLVY